MTSIRGGIIDANDQAPRVEHGSNHAPASQVAAFRGTISKRPWLSQPPAAALLAKVGAFLANAAALAIIAPNFAKRLS